MDNLKNQDLLNKIQSQFGEDVSEAVFPYGLLTFTAPSARIIEVLQFVKEGMGFNYLTDITAVHYPERQDAFAVVYHVYNMKENQRIRIKAYIGGEEPTISTATVLWNGANWMERETYDFFGIHFQGHPDLRRILNMDDLDVFPMRKEYPLEDPNRIDKKDFYFGR